MGFIGFALIPASVVAIRRRNPEAAIALHHWQAFRRYLTDFSQLRTYPAPAVVLWEKCLVFAVTLGVAREVISQLRELYPHMAAAGAQSGVFSNWVVEGGNPLASMGAMESAFSSFSATLSTATSSFSSGSGGGGGFSGGGGGGGEAVAAEARTSTS